MLRSINRGCGIPREPRPVTFWCELGGHAVTELHIPGNPPHYCAAHIDEAKRNMAKMRVRAMRRRQAEADPFGSARLAQRKKGPGEA